MVGLTKAKQAVAKARETIDTTARVAIAAVVLAVLALAVAVASLVKIGRLAHG